MKKCITAILLAGVLLTACGKDAGDAAADSSAEIAAAADSRAGEAEKKADEAAEATPAPEETAVPDTEKTPTEEVEEPCSLFNDFFAASLKEYDLPEGEDEMVTVVFRFVNITDKTYYKNDEEIPAGETWEKIISYPKKKWEDMAGDDCWIHYDLYEDDKMQTRIFKGGLKFTIDEELKVTGMCMFED